MLVATKEQTKYYFLQSTLGREYHSGDTHPTISVCLPTKEKINNNSKIGENT